MAPSENDKQTRAVAHLFFRWPAWMGLVAFLIACPDFNFIIITDACLLALVVYFLSSAVFRHLVQAVVE